MKVRDHCHFTGNFRGAAHSKCNIKARVDITHAKIPVFLHNFGMQFIFLSDFLIVLYVGGYDSHFILQAYASEGGDIGVEENIDIIESDDHDDQLVPDDAETHQFTARSKGRNLQVLAKSFEKFISLQVDKHIVYKVNTLSSLTQVTSILFRILYNFCHLPLTP